MLKYEIERLFGEIKKLFEQEDNITVSYSGHFIEKIEDRRLIDVKNVDGSFYADYIDSGCACLILTYDGIDALKQIRSQIDNILQIIAKHGFSAVNEFEHSLSRTREYGEVTISFNGIKE